MIKLTADEWRSLEEGYYFYQYGSISICHIWGGYAHFFGEVSQQLGNSFLADCVLIGSKIEIKAGVDAAS